MDVYALLQKWLSDNIEKTNDIPFGETSQSSFNNIDLGYDGSIKLGGFFDNHQDLKSELEKLSKKNGNSDYNFDIWLNSGGKISVRRSHENEGNWRSSGWHVIDYTSSIDSLSATNGSLKENPLEGTWTFSEC